MSIMLPSAKGLKAHEFPGTHINLWLEKSLKFMLLHSRPEKRRNVSAVFYGALYPFIKVYDTLSELFLGQGAGGRGIGKPF